MPEAQQSSACIEATKEDDSKRKRIPLKNFDSYCFLTPAKGFAILRKPFSIPIKIGWHALGL
jgi:hypothetical protein